MSCLLYQFLCHEILTLQQIPILSRYHLFDKKGLRHNIHYGFSLFPRSFCRNPEGVEPRPLNKFRVNGNNSSLRDSYTPHFIRVWPSVYALRHKRVWHLVFGGGFVF